VPCSDCQSDCSLRSLKRVHSPRCNASSMMSFPVRPLPPIIRSLIFDEIYPRGVPGEVCEEGALDYCQLERFQESVIRSCDGTMRLCLQKTDASPRSIYIYQGGTRRRVLLLDQYMARNIETCPSEPPLPFQFCLRIRTPDPVSISANRPLSFLQDCSSIYH
jgi:hypothetical protein